VDVARYRAELAALTAGATAPAAPPAAPAPAPPPIADASVSGPPVAPPLAPAGFWIRVGAVLIDAACVMAAEMVFGLLVWGLVEERLATAASRAFRFLAGPCYFIFLHWARGQTLGKMAFHIRVVDLGGGPLSLGQAALRHVGSWLSALLLGIGYLFAALRADKRALHDLIARTRVEHLIPS
jgi:uncharacterized RDD family membrane protein YckC